MDPDSIRAGDADPVNQRNSRFARGGGFFGVVVGYEEWAGVIIGALHIQVPDPVDLHVDPRQGALHAGLKGDGQALPPLEGDLESKGPCLLGPAVPHLLVGEHNRKGEVESLFAPGPPCISEAAPAESSALHLLQVAGMRRFFEQRLIDDFLKPRATR